MPQLDKFIFLNQIVSLTIFFFITYIYMRGTVIPSLSSLLKYRNKKINKLNKNLLLFNRAISSTHNYFETKSLSYMSVISSSFLDMISFYNAESLRHIITSYKVYQNKINSIQLYSFKRVNFESIRVSNLLK